jgi:hypothetical protein
MHPENVSVKGQISERSRVVEKPCMCSSGIQENRSLPLSLHEQVDNSSVSRQV